MKKSTLQFLLLFILILMGSMFACNQLLKTSSSSLSQSQTEENADDSIPDKLTDTEEEIEEPQEQTTDPYSQHYTWLADSFLIHLTGGIPFDADTTDDYLIYRSQYVLSYNTNKGVPNWVSWQLDSSWFGNSGRYSGNFITDHSLPNSCYKPKHSDYTNTGFDRGHIVRSHERTRNLQDNRSTFLMTNIVPQTPDLNRGVWLRFERFCESLCLDSGFQLLVISGGIYPQNRSLNNLGKVSIPDSCFKIVLAIDKKMELNHIDSSARMYCVMMPNEDGIMNDPWEKYRTHVQHIEKASGYHFLSRLPNNLQQYLKGK